MRPLRRRGAPDRPGADAAAPPRIGARRDGGREAEVPGEDPPGRRVHPERPLRGRHAPARLLHPEADPRRRRARRLVGEHRPPAGRRREDAGRERLRRDRDLPGGPPHPAGAPLRPGRAGRGGLRLHRQERARAAPGAGRRPLAGGRVPDGRARLPRAARAPRARGVRRVHRRPPRSGGAAGAERHQGDAGRRLPIHGPHRRRRHRPGPHPDRGDRDDRRATT